MAVVGLMRCPLHYAISLTTHSLCFLPKTAPEGETWRRCRRRLAVERSLGAANQNGQKGAWAWLGLDENTIQGHKPGYGAGSLLSLSVCCMPGTVLGPGDPERRKNQHQISRKSCCCAGVPCQLLNDLRHGSEDDMGEGATEAWDFINRFKEKVLLIALVVQCIR